GMGGNLTVGSSFTLGLGNIMFGGTGVDDMRRRDGIDLMFGGSGNDTLCAGVGYTLNFSNGDFTLQFGDLLFGGDGDDTIYGDACTSGSLPSPCHPEDFGEEEGDI